MLKIIIMVLSVALLVATLVTFFRKKKDGTYTPDSRPLTARRVLAWLPLLLFFLLAIDFFVKGDICRGITMLSLGVVQITLIRMR